MSCHNPTAQPEQDQVFSSAVVPAAAQVQARPQDRAQDQQQARVQEQDQKQDQDQQQRSIRLGTVPTLDHQGLHGSAEGTLNEGAEPDPFEFRVTVGVLNSSNTGVHRSGSIFHGSSASFGGICGTHFWRLGHDDEEESDLSGSRVHLGLRGTYTTELAERESLILGLGLNRDLFPDEDLGRTAIRFSAGWQKKGDDGNLKVTGVLHQALYDGASADEHDDHTALGFNLNYHHFLSTSEILSSCFRYRMRQYEGEPEPRDPDFSASLAYSRKTAEGGRFGGGFALTDRNNPKHPQNRYFGPSLFAVADMPFAEGLVGQLSAEAGLRDFDAPDENTGVIRNDVVWDVGIALIATDIGLDATFLRLGCHHTQADSNIESYDADEQYCAAALETRF